MVNIVISQPMYFPWVGMLEQIKNADVFVNYADVQFVKGSFFNRVQVKLSTELKWLTVPLRDVHLGQEICDVQIDEGRAWREQHLAILKQAYNTAPHKSDMIKLVEKVFSKSTSKLSDLAIDSMMELVNYFNIARSTRFIDSRDLSVNGSSSQRVHDLCLGQGATKYITGHGAANYLDHELFDKSGIEVNYMQYQKIPYPQLHGAFTPFVSALDLVANCGRDGAKLIASGYLNWRDYLKLDAQHVDKAKPIS